MRVYAMTVRVQQMLASLSVDDDGRGGELCEGPDLNPEIVKGRGRSNAEYGTDSRF